LQHWERNDDPWMEHAKWFPQCEYLLQRKGIEFVTRVTAMHPNLNRPQNNLLARPPRIRIQDLLPPHGIRIRPHGRRRQPSPPPQVHDPRAEEQEKLQQILDFLNDDVSKSVIDMGYSEDLVKKVLTKKMDETGSAKYDSVAKLFEDTCTLEEKLEEEKLNENKPTTSTSEPTSSIKLAADEAEKKLQQLSDEMKCKVCLDNEADVCFIPCGHLCTCVQCANKLKQCPICRTKIQQSIRTYKS